jgi:hypothetical protein
MAFVIDGAEWQFDGWSEEDIEMALGRLLDRVTIAQGRRERVWMGDDLQTRSVLAGLSIWELWSPHCESTLERLAPHAFPDLCFIDGIWRGLSDFAGGYLGVRERLRELLAVLDDHGRWAFAAPPPNIREEDGQPDESGDPSDQLIQQRFKTHGVDLAPEKSNVKRDTTCRVARERVLAGRTLYCEWHARLRGDQNRVHLHAPVSESGGKLIVAIFHSHLPLPGDH